jgi:hypothetical protein
MTKSNEEWMTNQLNLYDVVHGGRVYVGAKLRFGQILNF